MRTYAPKMSAAGISYDRYRELHHWIKQYDRLPQYWQVMIEKAEYVTLRRHMRDCDESYVREVAEVMLRAHIDGLAFRYVDKVPYSESQYKRIRREFFAQLDSEKRGLEKRLERYLTAEGSKNEF